LSAEALLLSPEAPYPIAGGGALRTASLLHYLARRYRVHLIVFRQPGDPDPAGALPVGLVDRVSVIDLPPNRRDFASRAWRNAVRVARAVPPLFDRFSGFAPQIEKAVAGRRYAVAIVEHFWCAPYLDQLSPVSDRTVLDLVDVESVLHERCAAIENGPTGFAHRLFRQAALDLERTWYPRYSEILTTSENDARIVRETDPGARITVYPNSVRLCRQPPPGDEEAIVFSGNMEYHPNRAAVHWFRHEVWPILRGRWPSLEWRLVGRNPQAVREFAEGDPRIVLVGPVDDAVRELARSRVAIVPLLSGSGTRLKILEAWAAGLPVVSTTIGAEGLPTEPLQLADSPRAFAEAVSRLLASAGMRSRVGAAGRQVFERQFTWESAWERLDF
jgi:polysaccharide biosynthesis protein PslH